MRRDLDLIRKILLDIEGRPHPNTGGASGYHFEHEDRDAVANALELLREKGLITAKVYSTHDSHPSDWFGMVRLTWEGSDFLDSVRDDEIWRKTKEGAKSAGGFTFDLVKELAKGFLKKKIQDNTGIELEI